MGYRYLARKGLSGETKCAIGEPGHVSTIVLDQGFSRLRLHQKLLPLFRALPASQCLTMDCLQILPGSFVLGPPLRSASPTIVSQFVVARL